MINWEELPLACLLILLREVESSQKKDRRNFFIIARASAFECVAIIDILKDQGKISDNEVELIMNGAEELSKMLFAMIKNLSK